MRLASNGKYVLGLTFRDIDVCVTFYYEYDEGSYSEQSYETLNIEELIIVGLKERFDITPIIDDKIEEELTQLIRNEFA